MMPVPPLCSGTPRKCAQQSFCEEQLATLGRRRHGHPCDAHPPNTAQIAGPCVGALAAGSLHCLRRQPLGHHVSQGRGRSIVDLGWPNAMPNKKKEVCQLGGAEVPPILKMRWQLHGR